MVKVDHIGISARHPEESARFLADILGLGAPRPDGPDQDMFAVDVGDRVTLLFSFSEAIATQHVAFRLDANSFDDAVRRLVARDLSFGNDPEDLGNLRSADPLGGHGRAYFVDPSGHLFEICS
jgi:catechol 2,3-dioxygenase-like lactoylglutathione lyase family enzyme